MKRRLKSRKDLDDDQPSWVTETDPRIPRCIKCGATVPTAKTLHTVCRRCLGGDESVQKRDVRALIRGVIAKLDEDAVGDLVKIYGEAAKDSRVRIHAERLIARGIRGSMAYRQAESMVADAAHAEHCDVCSSSAS